MDVQQLSDLEILERFRDGHFPRPTMANTIPMEFKSVSRGEVEFRAVAGEEHLNPMGGVHGGFAATVLDSAAATAVHSMLGPGESYGTVDLNVKMLRPVPLGKTLRAKGKVIHISRRLGISEATLTDMDGKIYGHATSTCMILREKRRSHLIPVQPGIEAENTVLGRKAM